MIRMYDIFIGCRREFSESAQLVETLLRAAMVVVFGMFRFSPGGGMPVSFF